MAWFDSSALFTAEVTSSCLGEESRSPSVVTWGEGGTPSPAQTPLFHGMSSSRDAHTPLARTEGTAGLGETPGAAGRPKNTSPGRRFLLEELSGLSESPGSQGRIAGSRGLSPSGHGLTGGTEGGFDAGDALRVGLMQVMPG